MKKESDLPTCVYVAGAYSAPNVLGVLDNMRRGIDLSYYVLKAGFAPFCPWLDYHFSLVGDVTLDEYYRCSLAWLEASEAVLVVPQGTKKSKGLAKELKLARKLGIPVFRSLADLRKWRNG